jgi:hypothetical protein
MPEDLAETKGFWVVLDSADGTVEFGDGKRVAHFRLTAGNGRVMARLTRLTPRAVVRSAFFIDGCHFGAARFEFDLENLGPSANTRAEPRRSRN